MPRQKGFKHTVETKQRIRNAHLKRKQALGYVNSPEARVRMSIAHLGVKLPEKTKREMSIAMKRRYSNRPIYTLDCAQCGETFNASLSQVKIGRKYCSHKCYSCSKKGKAPYNKGRRTGKKSWNNKQIERNCSYCKRPFFISPSEKSKRFCSMKCYRSSHEYHPAWNKGLPPERQSNWKGGKSFETYTKDFSNVLKELVRQRDNHKCQSCGVPQVECIRKLCTHHIDYDKKNNKLCNLVSLCDNCHSKANGNREYWEKYFNKVIKEAL